MIYSISVIGESDTAYSDRRVIGESEGSVDARHMIVIMSMRMCIYIYIYM